MSETWLISDTHFNHSRILTFTDSVTNKLIRGDRFSSIDEMNEHMIEQWNSVVKPNDTIYHLGDVFFGNRDDFEKIWGRLNGRKKLIVGNHDNIKYLSTGEFFEEVLMWKLLTKHKMLLTHVPVHQSNLDIYVSKKYNEGDVGTVQQKFLNIHGHIHQNLSPAGPYVNMSVEAINYTPVNIQEVHANV